METSLQLGQCMKRASLIIALALGFAAALGAFADDQAKGTKPSNTSTAKESKNAKVRAAQKEHVALTGSYIKRDIRRNGIVTDGPSPVFVVDRHTIDTSGAADLRQ